MSDLKKKKKKQMQTQILLKNEKRPSVMVLLL